MFISKFLQRIFPIFGLLFMASFAHAGLLTSSDSTDEATSEEKNHCQTPFTEGKKFNAPTTPYKIVTSAFGKRYNESYLKTILDISGEETVRFLKEYLKVGVFIATPASNNIVFDQCLIDQKPYFNSLEKTSEGLQSFWEEVESYSLDSADTLNGSTTLSLLGTLATGSATQNHAILLHPHSGRATLVHESFHALFIQQRLLDDPTDDPKLREKLYHDVQAKAKKNINQFFNSPRVEDLEETLTTFTDYIRITLQIYRNTSLEEFLIEKTLLKYVKNNQFKNIEDYGLQESINYMLNSIRDVGTHIAALDDLLTRLCSIKVRPVNPNEKLDDSVIKILQNVEKICKVEQARTTNILFEMGMEDAIARQLIASLDKKKKSKPISNDRFSETVSGRHPEAAILKRIRQDRDALIELLHRLPETL